MKKILLSLTAALLLLSCKQDKIAFVDNTKLINEYQEKIDMEATFKTKIEKLNQKTDSIGRLFQAEVQDFESQAQRMGQAAAQEKYNALMQKRQNIASQLQSEEQQISQASQQEIDSLLSKVRNFVKEYGKKNNYTFILGANEAGSVLYGNEAKDITNAVLTELNNTYKK